MTAFCIDFAANGKIIPLSDLEVLEYEPQDLADELREWGVTKPEHLSDWDRRVFTYEADALDFLDGYKHIYRRLGTLCRCHSRSLPALAYRRRMLVFTLMGIKMSTSRTFAKDWRPGQLVNLHDRTHFLTVKIKSILKNSDGDFDYQFELP